MIIEEKEEERIVLTFLFFGLPYRKTCGINGRENWFVISQLFAAQNRSFLCFTLGARRGITGVCSTCRITVSATAPEVTLRPSQKFLPATSNQAATYVSILCDLRPYSVERTTFWQR